MMNSDGVDVGYFDEIGGSEVVNIPFDWEMAEFVMEDVYLGLPTRVTDRLTHEIQTAFPEQFREWLAGKVKEKRQ